MSDRDARLIEAARKLGALDGFSEVNERIKVVAQKHRAGPTMSPQYFQALQDVLTEIKGLMDARRKEKA